MRFGEENPTILRNPKSIIVLANTIRNQTNHSTHSRLIQIASVLIPFAHLDTIFKLDSSLRTFSKKKVEFRFFS